MIQQKLEHKFTTPKGKSIEWTEDGGFKFEGVKNANPAFVFYPWNLEDREAINSISSRMVYDLPIPTKKVNSNICYDHDNVSLDFQVLRMKLHYSDCNGFSSFNQRLIMIDGTQITLEQLVGMLPEDLKEKVKIMILADGIHVGHGSGFFACYPEGKILEVTGDFLIQNPDLATEFMEYALRNDLLDNAYGGYPSLVFGIHNDKKLGIPDKKIQELTEVLKEGANANVKKLLDYCCQGAIRYTLGQRSSFEDMKDPKVIVEKQQKSVELQKDFNQVYQLLGLNEN